MPSDKIVFYRPGIKLATYVHDIQRNIQNTCHLFWHSVLLPEGIEDVAERLTARVADGMNDDAPASLVRVAADLVGPETGRDVPRCGWKAMQAK